MSPNRVDWDPLSDSNVADPLAECRRMRGGCPVAYTAQFGGGWAVFKHADIERIAADPETFSSEPAFIVPDYKPDGMFPLPPVQSDPPQHTHYRGLVAPFFRGSRLARFEPELVRITNSCINEFIEAGSADIAMQLNHPVSASALAMLMGLPASDGATFIRWARSVFEASVADDQQLLVAAFGEISAYVNDWMEVRKADPTNDMMSVLLQGAIDGRKLTYEEILGLFMLFIVGGFETTADTLSSTIRYLSGNPELCDRLYNEPKLMTKAVGEFVRAFAPVQATARTATRDVTVGDRCVSAGERILMMWASGSHDEDMFPHPEMVDIDRPGTHKATAFGSGIHRCVGEPLARLEMRAVLNTWLTRIKSFAVDAEPQPSKWPTLGWVTMPMRFTRR